MSAAAVRRPERFVPAAPAIPVEAPRRHIEIAPSRQQRRARPRFVHALIAVAGVFAVFAAQLGLSIALSAGAYRIGELEDAQRALQRTAEHLDEQLQVYSSTQHLAVNAAALGMVPGGSQYYLDLATGSVAAAPGMTDPFGCGTGCTLVPNSLTTGLPLATAAAAAKVVGTVEKPAPATAAAATTDAGTTDETVPTAVSTTTQTDAGTAAQTDASTTTDATSTTSDAAASVDSPVTSGTLPSPVTH